MQRECSSLDEEDLLSGLESDECLELFGLYQAQPERVSRRARVLPVSETRGQINVKRVSFVVFTFGFVGVSSYREAVMEHTTCNVRKILSILLTKDFQFHLQ
jgi:hypothetical protein